MYINISLLFLFNLYYLCFKQNVLTIDYQGFKNSFNEHLTLCFEENVADID